MPRPIGSSLAGYLGESRPWARVVVRVASLALPRGSTRDRYRREFVSDLASLGTGAQAAYCLRVLTTAPALRLALGAAVTSPMETTMPSTRKPFLCRFNLHHRWELATTDDGAEYVRCERCLKDRGGPLEDGRTVSANVTANYGSMN